MKRYVIIGNGAAAAACIEGIRSRDAEGEITVVSEEEREVYCRPLISYYLQGKTDEERMRYRDADFYRRMGCRVLFGRRAVRILKDRREAELDDGAHLPFDALCLATGSSPFVPPMEGLDTVPRRFSFMTLDDAMALERAVGPTSRVLIIGAGLIGLKCAEGLSGRASEITVCDLADRVLSSILDAECAAMMQRHLEKHGIRCLLSDSVGRFEGGTAVMKSGASVSFDVLVLAVGVRPNVSLLKEIGGDVGRGIRTGPHMETSVPGIYAAGDCVEAEEVSSGQPKVMAILPNAVMQGRTAGSCMAGGDEVFDRGIPMNSIGFFGLHAMTAGAYEGDMYEEKTEDSLKRLFSKNGLLKGFILIGREERAGIYTSLIRERTPLASIDFELMKKTATTAAFSADARVKKFGGVV